MPLIDIARSVPEKWMERSLSPGVGNASIPTWDLYLDGALVASEISSETAARLELDMVAWCAMFGEATLAPDAPISDEALELALSIFDLLFLTPKVREKARTAREMIIRPAIYTINRDGSLSVLASSTRGRSSARRSYAITTLTLPRDHDDHGTPDTYQVTITCECMHYRTRAHEHGGCCKHVAARLLLYLAQQGVGALTHLQDALTENDPGLTAPIDTLAFLEIDGRELSALLFLAVCARQAVVLHATAGTLQLTAGALSLTFPCADGGGCATLAVDPADVATLYDQLRPVAKQIATLTVFIDPADHTIAVCDSDSDLSITIHGKDIHAPPAPDGA
jgi:hypothetical protein